MVLERTDPDHRTKGYALQWGMERALAQCELDALCVFDADNRVATDFLATMNDYLAAGHVAIQADLTVISLPPKSVQFVSFLDFLEHLPRIDLARRIVANMETVARDFLFIRHPNFDDTDYLKSMTTEFIKDLKVMM